jgi:hypothetical protein
MLKNQILAVLWIAYLGLPVVAAAADTSCAAVNKAGELGLKQSRIHYAADLLRPAVPKASDKIQILGESMMHSITIENTQFMALDGITFSTTVLKSADERSMMTGVALFQAFEGGCRSLGKAIIAGRSALVFETGSNKTVSDSYYKFWIDAQTGLPLRGTEDAPAPEIKSFGATKGGRPKIEVQSNPKNERIINTTAFVFGDIVKPPKLAGAKNLFGQKGEMEPAATTMLKALIKG